MMVNDTKEYFKVKTLAPISAEVEDVDLSNLDDSTSQAVQAVWQAHPVLRFRGQNLTDFDLMNFSRRFGALDRVPIRPASESMTEDPRLGVDPAAAEYVNVISNVKFDGKAIGGLGNYEASWHTDMSYNEAPPTASLLYAIEVPPAGGNTEFANMYAAYNALSPEMRSKLTGLSCIHDASRNSVGQLRRGFEDIDDPRKTVGARHPIIRTHPVTRKKCLFLGRRRAAYIPELNLSESEALLDHLWSHATQIEFCWTQKWQAGDLVIWDNRCVMHRRDEFDDRYSRIMHRTQICGDKPY